jgi:hypothetical protein
MGLLYSWMESVVLLDALVEEVWLLGKVSDGWK